MSPQNLDSLRSREQNRTPRLPGYAVAAGIQRQVANSFNLFLNYKYYHWQTSEPIYKDLHIIFDEFATETHSTIEKLTERIKTMGLKRVRLMDFPNTATVKPAEKESGARQMLIEASFNELIVIKEVREIINRAKNIDPVSARILKNIGKTHEKHHWWLRYILENRQWLFEQKPKFKDGGINAA
jgi:starvation-inducible DNA-binding protein